MNDSSVTAYGCPDPVSSLVSTNLDVRKFSPGLYVSHQNQQPMHGIQLLLDFYYININAGVSGFMTFYFQISFSFPVSSCLVLDLFLSR